MPDDITSPPEQVATVPPFLSSIESAEERAFLLSVEGVLPAWLPKLSEQGRAALLRRPLVAGAPWAYDPDHYPVEYWPALLVAAGVATADYLAAIRNPALPGMYQPEGHERDRAEYVWDYWMALRRSVVHADRAQGLADLAEFDGLHFVREYGGKACALRFHGHDLVVQTMPELAKSYPDKFVMALDHKGAWNRKLAVKVLQERTETWQYDRAVWKPGRAASARELNLWRGWQYPDDVDDEALDDPRWPKGLTRMKEHVEEVMCQGNLEHADWLLLWLAHALQRPWQNSEVALVLIGPMGSGKDFFANAIAHLFRGYSLILDKPGQLTGNFNSHLQRALFVTATEGFFASRAQADVLKALVTADEILVEPKGLNAFMSPKSFRLVITANRLGALHIEEGDRRYFVLNVDAGENNKNPDYHGPLREEWYNRGGAEALFQWLRGPYWQRRLVQDAGLLRTRPTTKLLQEQRLLSLDKPEMAIHNMLMSGVPPCRAQMWGENDALFLPTTQFVQAARLDDRAETHTGRLLAKLAIGSDRTCMEPYGRVQGKVLAPLPEARKRWEAHLKQPVDWDADVQQWTAGGAAWDLP